jgi:hypothetical protein
MPAISVFLEQSSALFDLDPPDAPIPLGPRQYDAGRVLLGSEPIGEYLLVKDAHAVTLNVAALTITLFFPDATPVPITLQGRIASTMATKWEASARRAFRGL